MTCKIEDQKLKFITVSKLIWLVNYLANLRTLLRDKNKHFCVKEILSEKRLPIIYGKPKQGVRHRKRVGNHFVKRIFKWSSDA